MNPEIMKTVGFSKQVKLVEEHKCPICEKPIDLSKFKDDLSKREYEISGMCQDCQDKIFEE